MWVDEHLGKKVKLKVYDTVLVGGIEWLFRRDGSREDRRHLLSDIKSLRDRGRPHLSWLTYSDTTKP